MRSGPSIESRVPVLARRTHAGWRTGLLLVALCLAVYLPGLSAIPAVDRDESRFAQASRQMLTGDSVRDWVVPMVQDRPRLNKPPLIYWLQAGSVAAFTGGQPANDAIWMYRVPSLLAAIGTVLVTWRIGLRLYPAGGVAALGAAMLAVAPIMAWEARQARADQVLVLSTVLAMWAVLHIRHSTAARWLPAIGLWLAIGIGVLVKGPLTPMVVTLAAIGISLWSGSWRWIARAKPLIGIAIVLAMVSPWVFLVARAVGFEEYVSIIYDETLGRSKAPKEGHWGPPGYHLALIIVVFWPGAILTAVGVLYAMGRVFRTPRSGAGRLTRFVRSWRHHSAELFLIAWLVPSWVVFELVQTKLPHYTMTLLPALALLSARAVVVASSRFEPLRGLARLGGLAWIGFGLVFAVLTVSLAWFGSGTVVAIPVGLIALTIWWLVASAAWRQHCQQATFLALGLAALFSVAVGVFLPRIELLWNSSRLVSTEAMRSAIEAGLPIGAIEYHEDSLVFETRGLVERIDAEDLDAWLAEHESALLVLPLDAAEADPRLQIVARIAGFNYSNGSRVDLAVARERE